MAQNSSPFSFPVSSFFAAFFAFLIVVGLGVSTYFLVDQVLDLKAITDNKVDKTAVYDRKQTQEKLPSGGLPGPAGPKGDPGQIGIELLITNDYSYAEFTKLPDSTPIDLVFAPNFKQLAYANTVFVGWILGSSGKDKNLMGKLYDFARGKFLANYHLETSLMTGAGASDQINWIFRKASDYELLNYYYKKLDLLPRINNKINAKDVYKKIEVDGYINDMADKTTVYTKTEVDKKLENFPGVNDHYTKQQIDSKINAKIDKTATYTKTVLDTKLASKQDRTTVYDKAQLDSLLNAKINKDLTYSQIDINTKFLQVRSNQLKLEKISATETKVTSDFEHPHTEATQPTFRNDRLELRNFKFFKGDRLKVAARIITGSRFIREGLFFEFKVDGTNDQPTIRSLYHWNRWYANNKMNAERYAPNNDFVTTNFRLPVSDYPLFIAHNLFFNFYETELNFFFGTDFIYVSAHGVLNNSTDINDTYSLGVLNYPTNYDPKKPLVLNKISNFVIDTTTTKKTSSTSSMQVGTIFVMTGDWDNQFSHHKVPSVEVSDTRHSNIIN